MNRAGRGVAIALLLAVGTTAAADDSGIGAGAAKVSKAVAAGDFETMADMTYPRLIELMGGRSRMIESVSTLVERMRSGGVEILSVEVLSISDVVQAGSERHAVVETSTRLRVPGGHLTQKSFMIAVSGAEGGGWSYVDGAQLTEETAGQLFPDFNPALKLPAKEQPVFHPE